MNTLRLLLAWALLCGELQAADAPKPAGKPNILILLADDMGYGDPGCYNPKSKIATPHIDRLAGEGMRFTDAHAPGPLCHPSSYGLLTGRYPFRTDISRWPKQDSPKPFLLYFALTAPHTPWLPSPEFVGKSGAGMHGDFTTMVDAEIGRILAALDKSGRAEDTLVIFTSDNGPTWYEAKPPGRTGTQPMPAKAELVNHDLA